MSLVLEIEYLSGVCFAAVGPDRDEPDWPPQPDRIFSALIATWAAQGSGPDAAEALGWLEGMSPPWIFASPARARSTAIVFVPPNDARSNKAKHAAGVLPLLRSRQPRRFPAVRPQKPLVRRLWADARPATATLEVLQRLARDTRGHRALGQPHPLSVRSGSGRGQ